MYISKLYLRCFGKYHNRELELQKGVNLIYGPNEAGKTTIKDFIIGMFYGIERLRGIAARTDEYTRHEPFDGSGYSGSMELEQAGKAYLIDRSFRKDQKSLKVYQQDTGRELDTGDGSGLPETMVDMDKNGYVNTLCISSHGAVYGQDLQEEFRQYMMNVNATKTGNLDLKDAYNYLNGQKKALNRKGLENELQGLSRRMTEVHLEEGLEQIGRERDALEEKLVHSSGQKEQEQTKNTKEKSQASLFSMSREEKKQMDPQLRQIMGFIKLLLVFGGAALVLVLIFLLPVSLYYKGWLCVIALVISLYVWVMGRVKRSDKGKKKSLDSEDISVKAPSSKGPGRGTDAETGTARILEYSRRLSDLQVQENDLLKEYARQQELQLRYEEVRNRLTETDLEIQAIDLALRTIQELSGNIYDQYGPGISRRVSEMVSRITKGQYTDVKLDEQLHIKVCKDSRYIGAEFLSTGTLEQIYLAVRLAVAEEMSRAGMPLLLDDIFGAYDDARLEAVLQCLAAYGAEQVILFTASDRLADALDQTDIDYNYIEI
ncbi:MAG: AAA family ATPase [Bacteroides sp.]|nr:AAA family ATPase [Bacteroides sp.]MCM1550432.1 AAA family ATPase [Clostridium sp.]